LRGLKILITAFVFQQDDGLNSPLVGFEHGTIKILWIWNVVKVAPAI